MNAHLVYRCGRRATVVNSFRWLAGAGTRPPFNGQHKTFSSRGNGHHRRLRSRPTQMSPYDVLGISKKSTADEVKQAFLRLALQHHPDTMHDECEEKKKENTDKFVRIRDAFDTIKKGFRDEDFHSKESQFSEAEFDMWFEYQTGQRLNAAHRREVYNEVYKKNLTRTNFGPAWEIAFLLEEQGFFSKDEAIAARAQSTEENIKKPTFMTRRKRR